MQSAAARGLIVRIARLRPDRVTPLLAALAVLSAALIFARGVNYGVGVTPDSLAYFQTSENLAAAMRDLSFRTQYLHPEYPPLFPLLLAFAGLLGAAPLDASACLNAAAFGLLFFACATWLRRRARSRLIVAWTAAALFIAPPLTHAATWAYASPLFILCAMLALFSLIRFLDSRSRSALLAAGLFAALACLSRYIGASVVVVGVLALLLHPSVELRERAKNAAVYAVIAAAPVSAWLLRNLLAAGRLTWQGEYAPVNSLWRNILALADRIQEALFGWSGAGSAAVSAGRSAGAPMAEIAAAATALALTAAVLLFAKSARARSAASRVRSHAHAPAFAVLASFVSVYAAMLLVGVSVQGVESVSLRYFAPLWPPILLIIALALNALLSRRPANPDFDALRNGEAKRGRMANAIALALTAALSLWLLPQAILYADLFRLQLNQPLGIDNRLWKSSDAVAALRAKASENPMRIGTNNALIARFLTGIRAPYYYIPCAAESDVDDWIAEERETRGDAYVIWIDGLSYPAGCGVGLADVRAVAPMRTVDRFPNGAAFRLTNDPGDPLDAYRSAYAEAASGDPVIASVFDVHLRGGALTYLKEACAPADAQARFFLHVVPANENDLPHDRRRHGFSNLDFSFDTHGARFDGKCLTTAILPAYPISVVRTGQFIRGEGESWEGEFRPGA